MPRTNQDGKDVRLVLGWLCRRHFSDAELAKALDMPAASYSRRKDADDFPSFEELGAFAEYFGLSELALQVSFGYLDKDRFLPSLNEAEMRQYVEQGGGEVPFFSSRGTAMTRVTSCDPKASPRTRRTRRHDAPPA